MQRAGDDAQPENPGEECCGPAAKAEQSPCARTSSRGWARSPHGPCPHPARASAAARLRPRAAPRSAAESGGAARRPPRATPSLSVPYPCPSNSASTSGIDRPVATAMVSIRFETPGFSSRFVPNLGPRISDRCLELLAHDVRRIDHPHHALRRPAGGRHQTLGLLQVLDPRALVGEDAVGHLELVPAQAAVEALGDVPSQLEVLALVVADRNDVGLVEQDVAGHQHGVVE